MAESIKLKQGDIVRLKSGGPLMTVYTIFSNPNAKGAYCAMCDWFVGDTPNRKDFTLEQLVPTSDSNSPDNAVGGR